jgi:GAF domain-containing protein/HAMP domain-containing protein
MEATLMVKVELTKIAPRRSFFQSTRDYILKGLVNKESNTYWISIGVTVAALIGGLLYTYLAIQRRAWQDFALIGITISLFIVGIIGAVLAKRGQGKSGIWILLIIGQVSIAISPLFTAQLGVWYAAGIVMSTLIINTLTMEQRQANRASLLGLASGVGALLIDNYVTVFQLSPPRLLLIFIPSVIGFLALVYLTIILLYFPTYHIQLKISVVVISAVILSLSALGFANNYITRRVLLTTVNQTLLLAARQVAGNIDSYLTQIQDMVVNVAQTPYLAYYLNLPPENRPIRSTARSYLVGQNEISHTNYFALLDRNGKVIIHTLYEDTSQLPNYLSENLVLKNSLQRVLLTGVPYMSAPYFIANSQEPYFLIGIRIQDNNQQPLGILVVSFSLTGIQKIISNATGIAGDGSFAVLIDENQMRLVNGIDSDVSFKLIASSDTERIVSLKEQERLPNLPQDQLFTNYPSFQSGIINLSSSPFFSTQESGSGQAINSAAAVRLAQRTWTLALMQPQSIILAPIQQQTRITILFIVAVAVLAIIGSNILARFLSGPIVHLTSIANKASGGDLHLQAPVESQDEIGSLSIAFNSMIAQLRETLEGLEQRVVERTEELTKTSQLMEYRADRLQTVAEVAHEIASIQDPEELLPRVTREISDRFGFYHVGVFLLDKDRKYAVLQAANSDGGKKMLERGHRLKVGQVGIVGYVTGTGQARIVLNVGADAVYFNNPDLPQTRSEIALPLKSGAEVIGALDVQSIEAGAFTQDDIAILATLADQVAMAIENARLYSETKRTVRELQVAQRQYVRQAWGQLVAERKQTGYKLLFGNVIPLQEEQVIQDWENHGQEDDQGRLIVPIVLRGQVIGMINLEDSEGIRHWSEADRQLAEAIADQVGLALENARLLEETQHRAERERLVSEITTKMRASNDTQAILETAVIELRNALGVKSVQVRIQSQGNPDRDDNQNESLHSNDLT